MPKLPGEPTNDARAARVSEFARAYGPNDDPQSVVTDIVTDMLHWMTQEDPSSVMEIEAILQRAHGHFLTEVSEEEEGVEA